MNWVIVNFYPASYETGYNLGFDSGKKLLATGIRIEDIDASSIIPVDNIMTTYGFKDGFYAAIAESKNDKILSLCKHLVKVRLFPIMQALIPEKS